MATKKKQKPTATTRAPREVWIALDDNGALLTFGTTKRATTESAGAIASSSRVVGPYVLAERVRER